MGLDLWIHGPGYGESIVLVWDESKSDGSSRRAAVIDSYGDVRTPQDSFACRKLKELGDPPLAFVCGTHPHFDHVATLHDLLGQHAARIERVFWWGGHHRSVVGAYFGALLQHANARNPPRRLSDGICSQLYFIHWTRWLAGDFEPGQLALAQETSFIGVQRAYSGELPDGQGRIDVWAISPFLGPQKAYRTELEACIRRDGKADRMPKRTANETSLAFLIQFGQTQIILGGDANSKNWHLFREEWERQRAANPSLPKLNPDIIKVSHHGSKTSVSAGMWPADEGLFGTRRRGGRPQLAVVTPWSKNANSSKRTLPDVDVLEAISAAGCDILVTGGDSSDPYLQDASYEDSHVHLRVDSAGPIEVTPHLCEPFP
ncbi:MAG: hypothetical protein O3C21_07160 [Verrucomicrobia bacterium]|nr:hypothetical protein [Verrucomicrobiota bacterium]